MKDWTYTYLRTKRNDLGSFTAFWRVQGVRGDGTAVDVVERYFAAGIKDVSHPYRGQYDSKCSCCWLGFGHTAEYHTQNVHPSSLEEVTP